VPDGPAADIGLADIVHGDGRLDARFQAHPLQTRLQRQRIHHRGQHAHIVGGGTVDALGRTGKAAKDIAAAHHHADLGAGEVCLLHIAGDAVDDVDIDTEGTIAHQRLAGDFEQNPAVFRRCGHGQTLF